MATRTRLRGPRSKSRRQTNRPHTGSEARSATARLATADESSDAANPEEHTNSVRVATAGRPAELGPTTSEPTTRETDASCLGSTKKEPGPQPSEEDCHERRERSPPAGASAASTLSRLRPEEQGLGQASAWQGARTRQLRQPGERHPIWPPASAGGAGNS